MPVYVPGEEPKHTTLSKNEVVIMKYVCTVCGFVYDEAEGYAEANIAPGTKWDDVPEDFECPLCGVGKDSFEESND